MGDRDALVIFPEGGNFTPGRRLRAIDGLRRAGRRGRARQAARLGHVLAPRPAGTVSAIDAAPHSDLVIVAHTGLDHLDSAAAIWKGIPLRGPLRVTWWRIPAGDVPPGASHGDLLCGQPTVLGVVNSFIVRLTGLSAGRSNPGPGPPDLRRRFP
jgi:hypothetical protein